MLISRHIFHVSIVAKLVSAVNTITDTPMNFPISRNKNKRNTSCRVGIH